MTASSGDKDDQTREKLDSISFPQPPKKEVLIESFFPSKQKQQER